MTPSNEHISIVGNGAMATVCAIILTQNGHQVSMWGHSRASIDKLKENRENDRLLAGVRIPDAVRLTSEDADCFDGATMILSAVPTQYLRSVWTRLAKFAPADVPIVSVTKGIENGSLLRPTQVIASVLQSARPLAALSGPNIAAELARYLPATSVVASADAEFARRVQGVFSTQWFRV